MLPSSGIKKILQKTKIKVPVQKKSGCIMQVLADDAIYPSIEKPKHIFEYVQLRFAYSVHKLC